MPIAQSVSLTGGFTASNTVGGDYIIPQDGLAYPDFDVRLSYAPDADNIPGSVPTAATLAVGNLPLTITVEGSSASDLQAKRRALEAAFSQFTYDITITVGGQSETYTAYMAWPKWGVASAEDHRAIATLSVPVQPMGS